LSKFEIRLDDDLELRIVRVVEAPTFDEFVAFAEEEFTRHPTRNLIWDFSVGSLQLLDIERLKHLAELRHDSLKSRSGGNTLLIAHEPSEKILIKWYKTISESRAEQFIDYHICTSVEEALELLRKQMGSS